MGLRVRRFFESAVGNLPLLALLFVPICFGLTELYPVETSRPGRGQQGSPKKAVLLEHPRVFIRAAVVFAIWIIIAHFLLKYSAEQDLTVSVEPTRKMRKLSGPGLVIYPVTMTFAAVDWVMSLEKDWFSTMFPVLICIGQVLGALALVILLLSPPRRALRSSSRWPARKLSTSWGICCSPSPCCGPTSPSDSS